MDFSFKIHRLICDFMNKSYYHHADSSSKRRLYDDYLNFPWEMNTRLWSRRFSLENTRVNLWLCEFSRKIWRIDGLWIFLGKYVILWSYRFSFRNRKQRCVILNWFFLKIRNWDCDYGFSLHNTKIKIMIIWIFLGKYIIYYDHTDFPSNIRKTICDQMDFPRKKRKWDCDHVDYPFKIRKLNCNYVYFPWKIHNWDCCIFLQNTKIHKIVKIIFCLQHMWMKICIITANFIWKIQRT